MTCNLQNYFLIDIVDYWLEFSGPAHYPPLGYLFLCPLDNLQSAPACFRMPDCPAYWSLDPFGAEHLTADEARTLGFPDIQFRMKVWGRCWDHSVYTGIHQFQDAKGFDPYSQEAAIAMGSPLIEIACDRDALLTRSKQHSILLN
ncbi:hypothetical protein DFH06DRAFT_258029 [Mycena polygramma]|nr:hypothetical protein DFH06DRAFT_258029 [Mycena polygramma]